MRVQWKICLLVKAAKISSTRRSCIRALVNFESKPRTAASRYFDFLIEYNCPWIALIQNCTKQNTNMRVPVAEKISVKEETQDAPGWEGMSLSHTATQGSIWVNCKGMNGISRTQEMWNCSTQKTFVAFGSVWQDDWVTILCARAWILYRLQEKTRNLRSILPVHWFSS